ncbi:hypothetical protein DdX_20196 [Ditylenchus destructor]|uniref:Uncharacterized protein n=1 Tax=Ditylenchus destructor TaxID=166010 RepID=A0AAD4MGQ5_9BILA|nr:hypothetical protein DdX_20196 [Ditylenchus destructor]
MRKRVFSCVAQERLRAAEGLREIVCISNALVSLEPSILLMWQKGTAGREGAGWPSAVPFRHIRALEIHTMHRKGVQRREHSFSRAHHAKCCVSACEANAVRG